ncbi:prenyltransferase/squalene oxidase repeat-containing protein [Streptomyces sp. VNUA116]|uniref:prenyltransferase/squalene oxidase repeat-containing protein n=1 Tax=Streptomyces sp. VNUA116 TaxID=3062449 RepID=UPI00267533F2|nr:prenyltransferase/squalene oxidase repeat-containing protein [Streptomyces sp. VNUA116]WKU48273.1 prenyltransferase/squalene oxidase repeat-containing protein [Streptomyces sp. VNUA116]
MRNLGGTGTCSDSYNTAFVARVRRPDGSPRYPRALQWLHDRQHPDGSWGGRIEVPVDRLTSTLAAVRALVDYEEDPPPGPYGWIPGALRRGVAQLHALASRLRMGQHEPIGVEFTVPELTRQLRSRGLNLPQGAWRDVECLRRDKLARMAAVGGASGAPSLRYSMEVAPAAALAADATALQSPGGSVGCSPAATAALWQSTGDARALAYLDRLAHGSADGGAPEVHPMEAFETAWSLYHLGRAGLFPPHAAPHLDALADALGRRGWVGFSAEFPVPEADTTAMVINLLPLLGQDVASRLGLLLRYEADDHFLHYPGERGPSVSVNARILEAFNHAPAGYAPQRRKLIGFLREARTAEGYWLDKWHVSPYYATAHVSFALGGAAAAEGTAGLAATRRWLIGTQHPDGSWGMDGGQPEETAYAVLALHALADRRSPVPPSTTARAHRYLLPHLEADPGDFAELWLGKSLYTPVAVVRSAVIAAAHLSRPRRAAPCGDGR